MTDDEKVPYFQCLYHTGKTVYKYWLAALGIATIVIAIGLIVYKLLDKIIEVFEYLINGAQYISNCIGNSIGVLINIACSIPWYWWVLFGATVGPLIIVAIYCALKRSKYTWEDAALMTFFVMLIAAIGGIINLIIKIHECSFNDVLWGVLSIVFFVFVAIILFENDDTHGGYY